MTSMVSRLVPLGFFRANRSTLVNLARVREVNSEPGCKPQVILENKTAFPLTCPISELQEALTNLQQQDGSSG